MDAVLDTNVVVSAIISPKGPPGQIVKEWRAQSFGWVTSEALLEELERVLAYPLIRQRLAWSERERSEFVHLIRRTARVNSPTSRVDIITNDSTDNRVLEAAVEGQPECIVSGDRHLLQLGRYEGVEIVTPARFVGIIAMGLT